MNRIIIYIALLALAGCAATEPVPCSQDPACNGVEIHHSHFNPGALYQPPIYARPTGNGTYRISQDPNPFLMWQ